MLTRILHNSPQVCKLFDQVFLPWANAEDDPVFSRPQRRHLINVVDALLVCQEKKTLAALERQFVESVDVSNWADCFRISPWRASALREPLKEFLVHQALLCATSTSGPVPILVSIDDSLGEKDKSTRHIEPVSWHYDHIESTKKKPRYKNGLAYVVCTMCVGQIEFTFDIRIYLRQRTVRSINRHRRKDQRIAFISKTRLAHQILTELSNLFPKGWPVYVLFDSWYASARLIKFIRRQGWQAICAVKPNRKLNGKRIDQHARTLKHQRYATVKTTAADGKRTTYWIRSLQGQLEDVPFPVCVWVSKRHPREKSPAYFLSTDLTLEAQKTFQWYTQRWSCEVANFYLKTRLGLADFRVQAYEAVDKWVSVVHLSWAYLQWRLANERSTQLQTPADLMRRHQDEHARTWLIGACQLAIQEGSVEPVLKHFLREEMV
ncbi:MAG: transposase [Chloroflexota bacterium]